MAQRNLLHKSKLLQFKYWLRVQGYTIHENKGPYEVLRWTGDGKEPMPIVFEKDGSKEHYSCNESSIRYVRKWLRELKESGQDK